MGKISFNARLVSMGPGNAWTFLYFPKRASLQLGSKGRVPVVGRINGHPFRLSAFPTGDGTHQIAVNKAMQRGSGASPGETVRVELEIDRSPRTINVPPDLRRALDAAPMAAERFRQLAPSNRKAYVEWVLEAKGSDTRGRRIAETVRRVIAGIGAFE
jgi:hypothetical protein